VFLFLVALAVIPAALVVHYCRRRFKSYANREA
jgi:hypothetical protein